MNIPDFWIGYGTGMLTMFLFFIAYGIFLYYAGYRSSKIDPLTEFEK